MTQNANESGYTRATIHLRVEVAGDADAVLGRLREVAAGVAEDPEQWLGADIGATGAATVTEGWDDGGADQVVAAALRHFPGPGFDDITRRVSKVMVYGYTGDPEDLEAIEPADRALIEPAIAASDRELAEYVARTYPEGGPR